MQRPASRVLSMAPWFIDRQQSCNRESCRDWLAFVSGRGVWYIGDELLLPAFGVLKREDYTAAMQAEALVAHVVYGVATGLLYRQLAAVNQRPSSGGIGRS